MSIYKVSNGDVESFTIATNPHRMFSSSSKGIEGNVHLFARHSPVEKDVSSKSSFVDQTHDDSDIESLLQSAQYAGRFAIERAKSPLPPTAESFSQEMFFNMVNQYMDGVDAKGPSERKAKVVDITRFTPTFDFTQNTVKKLVVKDQLSSFYRTSFPSAHWAYTNYNCLNFFTSSTVPSTKCLLYPNVSSGIVHDGYFSGSYSLSGAFSFDFYINPCYTTDARNGTFKAGTILHLSSSYALSLMSGSAKDENGKPLAFRLQLQLSHSADVSPSAAQPGTFPSDLVFRSDDNSLAFNRWQHVVVRWGTNLINQGTGSFVIDGVEKGTFVVPSGTVSPRLMNANANPDVLCVGNYYEGQNTGTSSQAYFFANYPATRDGLEQLINDPSPGAEEPVSYAFTHPLNAQLHDVAIKRYYMSNLDIEASSSVGPKSLDERTAFYLPPFFVEESPFRQFVGNYGGILQTPFFEVDGTTNDPFNVALSFGVGGHYINIENFLRDFASNVFPRTHHLTASAIPYSTEARSANDFLYDQPFVRARNLLIMPCDDGLFVPSFELLGSESLKRSMVDDLNVEELSFIHLDELLKPTSLLFGADNEGTLSYSNESIGFTPENPGLRPGNAMLTYSSNVKKMVSSGTYDPGVQEDAPLTIFQRTRDASSNQVTFFDVSNLYYGKRIMPGTLEITDNNMSGSDGVVKMKLKDDGRGTVYRATCFSSASTWNAVGTVFYDDGIIVIKSPHLYFFGKESYEISFKGEQNVHVMSVGVTAPANQLNSSSNPNYNRVTTKTFTGDSNGEFVYISGINYHDDNFNVIMKTQLAQPIMKRPGEKIRFVTKMDF